MAAAPQTQGAPPKQGVLSPFLILSLLLLLPGSLCETLTHGGAVVIPLWGPGAPQPPPGSLGSKCQTPTYSPSPPPTSERPDTLTLTTTPGSSRSCGSSGGIHVRPGPTSSSGALGGALKLECRFDAPPNAEVTWLQVCPRRYRSDTWTCSWPQEVPVADGDLQVSQDEGLSILSFRHLKHNHSGLYFCRVKLGHMAAQSCGTFVRVQEPVPVPFLNLGEATKNRILTAQGVLLLLCAAGPGLLLLFRKRWANERLLQPKKMSFEEENLYEGLNLDECSMYEDISRGVQPTYQDVGTPPTADGLLEKP